MKDLNELRIEIDRIDRQIIPLFEERMALTAQVAAYKSATGKPVLDREHELQKLAALKELASCEENKEAVVELFEQIMRISREQQESIISTQN